MKTSEKKRIVRSIAEAADILPQDKREYLLGFAEGVIAMRDMRLSVSAEAEPQPRPSA